MSNQYLQIRTRTGFSVAVGYLESLIECLKRGTIFLSHEGKSLLLKPRTPISIDLEAEIKMDHATCKEKIVLKLQWEIRESWPRGKEIFSIARPDVAGCAPRDLSVFLSEPSGESGGKDQREAESREDTSDTLKDEASPDTIKKKPAGRGTKWSKPSVRKTADR